MESLSNVSACETPDLALSPSPGSAYHPQSQHHMFSYTGTSLLTSIGLRVFCPVIALPISSDKDPKLCRVDFLTRPQSHHLILWLLRNSNSIVLRPTMGCRFCVQYGGGDVLRLLTAPISVHHRTDLHIDHRLRHAHTNPLRSPCGVCCAFSRHLRHVLGDAYHSLLVHHEFRWSS